MDSVHRRDGDQDEGLRFLGPLYELCAIGLSRPALDAFCAGEQAAAPTIDRAYLLKILAEEVGRQFGHPLRPLVELVLNAVDASAGAPRPAVDVRLQDGHVEVLDEGEGMSLRTVLSRLLVPFATDKRPGVDLGRFGVGFFSVLGFGLIHPESFGLTLTTGDGEEGWVMRVVAGNADPASLLCSIHRAPPQRGTRVRVSSALLQADPMRSYLRDALHFFPHDRAAIRVDGATLNDGSLIAGGRLFRDTAASEGPDGAPLVGRFHVGGRGLCVGVSAATFHSGVKVEPCLAVSELALLDFPAAVELTEGRDALKPGPALDAVAITFYRRLARLAHLSDEAGEGRAGRDRLAEVAAQISALMLRSAGWSQVVGELAEALLGPGRYLVTPDRRETVLGFFGPAIAERLFVPESFWAERQWQPHLPGERELLERELLIHPPEALAAAARRRPDLAGLALLASRSAAPASTQVALCRPALRAGRAAPDEAFTPCGPLPCLATRRFILIREDSPIVARPVGWRGWYALRAAFDRAAGLREADFERELIVGETLATPGEASIPGGGAR